MTWKQPCDKCGWDVYPYCICAELRNARQAAVKDCIASVEWLPVYNVKHFTISRQESVQALRSLLDEA